jgi:DNA-binding CsgD family transcriptional regulator
MHGATNEDVIPELSSACAHERGTHRSVRAMFLSVRRPGRFQVLRPGLAPIGLSASRARIGGEELAVFSFPVPPPALPETLSAAEREVAVALLEGLSNSEIAVARRTSARTVANQVGSLFRKLGVRSRAEAVAALGRLRRV